MAELSTKILLNSGLSDDEDYTSDADDDDYKQDYEPSHSTISTISTLRPDISKYFKLHAFLNSIFLGRLDFACQ